MAEAPLGGLRVLDLTDEKAVFATRILADLGAEVIRVEPPEGGRLRRLAPFLGDIDDGEHGYLHLSHNANKASVTLDLTRPEGRALFVRLAGTADVLVESGRPGWLDELGIGWADLHARYPRLIMVSVTPFGLDNPWRDRKANDLVASAAGGLLWVCGSPEDPPTQAGGDQAYKLAGLAAATATMVALTGRQADGVGAHLDISIQDCVAMSVVQTSNPGIYLARGRIPGRPGMTAVHRCQDGRWVTLNVAVPRYRVFLEWLAEAGVESDARPADLGGPNGAVTLHGLGRRLAATMDRAEFLAGAWRRDIMSLPVNSLPDLAECDHLQFNQAFIDVDDEVIGTTLGFPRSPVDALGGVGIAGAPRLGEHNAAVYGALGCSADELAALSKSGVI
ncbi:MAG TPA: CaiB/BaiF CoA-transferase family protein [Acidimicrobiales bacterium]|nr:CaiB/BaiF CoA-transferase family protein [Acidimicrobiales bacterium]